MTRSVFSRRAFARVAAAAAALASMKGTTAGADEAAFDVALTSDVMVPMRDGVKLATDVYRPARNGKPVAGRFPVILERTPYGKTVVSRSERTATDPIPKSRAEVARFFSAAALSAAATS